jgi:hypothetical protein
LQHITCRPLRAEEFPHRFHDFRNPPTSGVGRRSRSFDEEVEGLKRKVEEMQVALEQANDANAAAQLVAGCPKG